MIEVRSKPGMTKLVRALSTFAAIAAIALAPAVVRAQNNSNQQNKQNNSPQNQQNPSVQSQQEAPGQQQQNPTSSPVPPNPEGALPYEPPPGPPPAAVSPPSYEDQYENQTDNLQQSGEVNQLQDQEEGQSQGGGAAGPAAGAASGGATEGPDYIGPDGMPNPPTCQQQSQHQNCTQPGGVGPPV
jgi:hypothetical protein